MLISFPRYVTRFHPWTFTSNGGEVGTISTLIWRIWRWNKPNRVMCLHVLCLSHSATRYKSYLCCTDEARSTTEVGVSVIFPWHSIHLNFDLNVSFSSVTLEKKMLLKIIRCTEYFFFLQYKIDLQVHAKTNITHRWRSGIMDVVLHDCTNFLKF